MDGYQFDRATQDLSRALNRRRLAAALAALGLAAGIGGSGDAAAKKGKTRKKRRCRPGKRCGSDAQGSCFCETPATGGRAKCFKATAAEDADSCAECPVGTTCVGEGGEFSCYQRCQAGPI